MTNVSRRTFLRTAGTAISGSLCMRYVGDEALAATAPQYLVPFTDPQFGSKVVKVTNPNNPVPGLGLTWGNIAIHHYSIDEAWNADQTLLRLDRGTTPRVFLDGKMLAILATRADGKTVTFAYNLETGQKYPDIDLSSEYRVGWTTISPKGSYIVSYSLGAIADTHQRRRVFTTDGKLLQTWSEYERPGHG